MADFSRVKPGDWAANEVLTAAQMNTLDTDHANSLNRTGGNVTGAITWTNTGTAVFGNGSTVTVQSGAVTTWSSGSTITLASGTSVAFQAAITQTGILSLAGGVTHLITGASTKLQTASSGRIVLGDTTDYVQFSANRSRAIMLDLARPMGPYGTGWSASVNGLIGPGTSNLATVVLPILHNGATLSQVKLFFTPVAGHAGQPTNPVAIGVLARTITAGATLPARSLVTAATGYSWVSTADYNDGQVKSLTHTLTQVIDTSADQYALRIQDENGTNALSGNVFHQVELTYSAIADMRFP